jgi:hypothetical protein
MNIALYKRDLLRDVVEILTFLFAIRRSSSESWRRGPAVLPRDVRTRATAAG